MEKNGTNVYAGRSILADIDLPSILRDVRRMLLYILLAAVAVGCFFYVSYPHLHIMKYSVSSVISIDSETSTDITTITSGNSLSKLEIFENILQSEVLKHKVQEVIGEEDYQVSLSAISETNIVTVTITAAAPKTALKALTAMLEVYPSLTEVLVGDLGITTLQQPTVSSIYTGRRHRILFSGIGFLAGMAVYIALVAVLSFLRMTVKSEKDIHNKIDASLLGTIPVLPRRRSLSDSKFLVSDPRMGAHFVEDYYLVSSRIAAKMQKRKAKTLLITSAAVHEGKTTTSINLAIALSRGNRKVLLVGADFRNPSIASILGIDTSENNKTRTLSDVLERGGRFTNDDLVYIPDSNVVTLFNTSADSHASKYMEDGSMRNLLRVAREVFDYVLVDTGPVVLVADTESEVSLCDASLLVISQDVAPIPVLNDVVDMLNGKNDRLIGCVFRVPQAASLLARFSRKPEGTQKT